MFQTIAIAGTFDRLHKGHRYFIQQAFKFGYKVIIGLTSDRYVEEKLKVKSEKLKVNVNNYETRKRELEEFLKTESLLDRAEIVKIDDVYGPTLENNDIEALIVTEDTYDGGLAVNRKRGELGLKSLKLLKIPLILAEDKKRIASTRVRLGEIDRLGMVFQTHISENLRQELKKPLGKLIRGNPDDLIEAGNLLKEAVAKTNSSMISTVGDEVTKLCNEVGIPINLAIVDFKVNRKEKYHSLVELGFSSVNSKAIKTPARWPDGLSCKELLAGGGLKQSSEVEKAVIIVNNPPGHITKELVNAVKNTYLSIIKNGRQRIIQVVGEEDLAGVPAILLAPLGGIVLYGQPREGVVLVEVTEEMKKRLLDLLRL